MPNGAPGLSAKDRVDCYLRFYDASLKSFSERRNFEWKFNLAVWAPIAIVIGFALKGDIKNDVSPGLLVLSHLIFFILYFWWSAGLHSANKLDRDWAFQYKDAVEQHIVGGQPLPAVQQPQRQWLGPLLRWAPSVQIALTALLLAVSLLLLS